jgi:Skp family chaperone for outer membrane proteins
MKFPIRALLGAVAAVFAFSFAPAASAQATSVVIFDANKVFADSMVGKDITAKLTAIQTAMNNEIKPDQDWVRAENTALTTATQGLTQQQISQRADLQPRIQTFQRRGAELERKIAIATREYQATEAKALQDFATPLRAAVQAAAQARGATVVLDRGDIFYNAPTVDITADVTNRLNTAVTTMNVVRQRMPQQPPAAAPAAPAPR